MFQKTFDLYPDVPNWAMAGGLIFDTVANIIIPPYSTIVGILPEIWQIMIDRYNFSVIGSKVIKEVVDMAKEVYFGKSEFAKKQVAKAGLVFK